MDTCLNTSNLILEEIHLHLQQMKDIWENLLNLNFPNSNLTLISIKEDIHLIICLNCLFHEVENYITQIICLHYQVDLLMDVLSTIKNILISNTIES